MNIKRILYATFLFVIVGSTAWAHKPLLSVDDNGDGTIYIEVSFSDGSSGSGHKVILNEKSNNKLIKEYTVPAESSMDIPMPKVPYMVTFSAGPGHEVKSEGPFSDNSGDAKADSNAPESQPESTTVNKTTTPKPSPVTAVSATPQPQVVSMPITSAAQCSPGMDMAFKMMIVLQVIIGVLLVFTFGAIAFWIGYSMGNQKK